MFLTNIKKIFPNKLKANIKTYNKKQKYIYGPHNKKQFKYKFKGIEKTRFNNSQCFQDMFVLTVLNGKEEGTYLEIGSGPPIHINNTYLLEKKYNWKGVGIELDNQLAKKYLEIRKNPVINVNALEFNFTELVNYYPSTNIDYLQIDIEPAINNYEVLKKIPFDLYKFNVITYETDIYVAEENEILAENARVYLENHKYKLVKKNVKDSGKIFEDWYINEELFDNLIDPVSLEENINANKIFFKNTSLVQDFMSLIKYFLSIKD